MILVELDYLTSYIRMDLHQLCERLGATKSKATSRILARSLKIDINQLASSYQLHEFN